MTAFAAAFMISRALLSLGFSKSYLLHILQGLCEHDPRDIGGVAYLVKPLPSILTTTHVLGSRMSGCSKALTYSNLLQCQHDT